MFLISFFTASVIRMVFGFVLLIVLLFVGFVAAIGVLAATGDPGDCEPGGGPISIDAINAATWQQKWDTMTIALSTGQPASATFSESELSSRADEYLQEHDVGFSDPRVCVHDGYAEASATFGWLGIDVKAKAKGTADLTGDHPRAEIDEMEIGNVPGWLAAPIEGLVNDAIDAALDDAPLDFEYTQTLRPGEATVSGTP